MKVAIVGSGVSGLVCAYRLAPNHRVTLFERDSRVGGHTHTHRLRVGSDGAISAAAGGSSPPHAAPDAAAHEREMCVDSGFIVFNTRNYPRFTALLDELDVPSRPSTMSFSVRDERAGIEYGGASLAGIIGSPRNLTRRRWWGVVRGVAALARGREALLDRTTEHDTIADLCARGEVSADLAEGYLLPMAGAIWSSPREDLDRFPARFLLRFFDNHGMLDLRRRPTWRTIVGGSSTYVDALLRRIDARVRSGGGDHADGSRSARGRSGNVIAIRRDDDAVFVRTADDHEERFEHVILATHADEALALLQDRSPAEREILGAMPFQANDAVLHTDARVLPRRRRCWAAWNARVSPDPARPACVTYNMTILQGLPTRTPICVTLNDDGSIDPRLVLARMVYHHPLYTIAGQYARSRWSEISSAQRRTHFCGAYWLNGFHEDGVVSADRVVDAINAAPVVRTEAALA